MLIYLLWGSTYLAIRLAVATIPPFCMAGIRMLVAGGLLYGWARWRGAAGPEPIHWLGATLVGGLLLLGGTGMVGWSEQRVPSGIAALIVGSVPLWMVLLEWLWHSGPRPTIGIISGLVIGFIGLGLLVSPGKFGNRNQIDYVGATALFLASFSWACGSLYSRRAKLPGSRLLAAAMEMLAGGVLLLAVSGATGEWTRFDPARVAPHSVAAWAYLTVFGSLVGFTTYIWLLAVSTPARVATYAYVNPVVAVFLGWAFLNEPITGRTLMAAAAIILAVVIIVTRSREAPAEL